MFPANSHKTIPALCFDAPPSPAPPPEQQTYIPAGHSASAKAQSARNTPTCHRHFNFHPQLSHSKTEALQVPFETPKEVQSARNTRYASTSLSSAIHNAKVKKLQSYRPASAAQPKRRQARSKSKLKNTFTADQSSTVISSYLSEASLLFKNQDRPGKKKPRRLAPEMQRVEMHSELKGLGWSQRSKSRKKDRRNYEESKPEGLALEDLQDSQQQHTPLISGHHHSNEAYFQKSETDSFKNQMLATLKDPLSQDLLDRQIELKRSLLQERTPVLKKSESAALLQSQTPTFQNDNSSMENIRDSYLRTGPVSTRNLDTLRVKPNKFLERTGSAEEVRRLEEDLNKWKHFGQLLASSHDELNQKFAQYKEEKQQEEQKMRRRVLQSELAARKHRQEAETFKKQLIEQSQEMKQTSEQLWGRLRDEQAQKEKAERRANQAEFELLQVKQYVEKQRALVEAEKQRAMQQAHQQEMLVYQLSQQAKLQKAEIEALQEQVAQQKENGPRLPNSARFKPQFIEHCWNQLEQEKQRFSSPSYDAPRQLSDNPFSEARSITKIEEVRSEYSESSIADDSIPREYDSSSAESAKGGGENRYRRDVPSVVISPAGGGGGEGGSW